MFNSLLDDPKNELLRDRLARLLNTIPALNLSTKEDYLGQVYGEVNRVLAIGVGMTPLEVITPESPAVLGDVIDNFNILNQDGSDIAAYILRIEDLAAQIYNLIATSQNSLRQRVREALFAPDNRTYREDFVNTANLAGPTNMVDVNAGVCQLPLSQETEVIPTITIGDNSIGAVSVGVSGLNANVGSALVWLGTSLELILTFPTPQIINRLRIDMDDYQGLEITSLTTSPDGNLVEDILNDLGVRTIELNGLSGKYSGDAIIDFPPRHTSVLRLVIEDRVGVASIALRGLRTFSRQYADSGVMTTNPISRPSGTVVFNPTTYTWGALTSITHQISYNGATFTSINPGDTITLTSSPFWYRAVLARSSSAFSSSQSPLAVNNADPLQSPAFILSQSNSVPSGSGIVQRTLVFQSITGPVPFRDTPLPGTLVIQQGSAIITPDQYAFTGNTLSFPGPQGGITASYQTSALGTDAISQRQQYYTPLLYEAQFASL